jgi:putative Mn2+ efflux pump MntP
VILQNYRHVVVRDSGINRNQQTATVDVNQRWTVSQIATSIKAVTMGLGFAWLPAAHIKHRTGIGYTKAISVAGRMCS